MLLVQAPDYLPDRHGGAVTALGKALPAQTVTVVEEACIDGVLMPVSRNRAFTSGVPPSLPPTMSMP